MTPNPRSLDFHWSGVPGDGELKLSTEALHGLHAVPSAKATAAKSP
jgi:hypothetical protein